jgi:hypothetical protein
MNHSGPVLFVLLGLTVPAWAGNWPGWRGPDGDGQAKGARPPLAWSAGENVHWKTPLPEAGNGSPIIWGGRVFLSQSADQGKRRAVWCLDRTDGRVLWKREMAFLSKESTHKTNPYCSATPVTDGERVIASLGSAQSEPGTRTISKPSGSSSAKNNVTRACWAVSWTGPASRV